ncbi:nat10, partial [Symbiodinium sp. KB8]
MRMGYGTRALQLLSDFYDGKIVSLDEDMKGAIEPAPASATPIPKESVLLTEELKPRKKLPPLMVALQDCKPERLQWLGVSFGLTADLFKFWNRAAFVPLYVRQTANELTGEHTVIMLRSFETSGLITPRGDALEPNWLRGYVGDFCRRFISLLGFEFRELSTTLALSVLDATAPLMATLNEEAAKVNEGGRNWSTRVIGGPLTPIELALLLTPHDIRRLEVYGRNMVDYHLIVDLLPTIARLWFTQRLTEVNLSRLQMAVLICLGLQHKNVDDLATEFRLPSTQVLALFNKAVRKLVTAMNKIQEQEESMDSELSKEGEKINKKMHKANLDLIKSLDLD